MTDIDLDHLARRQAGVVARRQLLAVGWSSSRLHRAVARGRLVQVVRGVYRVAGAPWSRAAAQHAAILMAGDGAVLARWSAAELHGIAEPKRGPVEVLAPHPRKSPEGSGWLLRLKCTRSLPDHEQSERSGLPATSGARTLLDLADVASTSRLTELVAAGVRVRACTLQKMRDIIEAHPNAHGRGRLRHVLDVLADDGSRARSDVEVTALQSLLDAGLPRPVVAHRVVDEQGRFIAEVDLAYPQLRLAIEIDGFRWHSSPERKRRDEQRQNRLVLAGWTVLRFSASEVLARPERLVSAVRRILQPAG
jgi:predicted transcriptional regulator of viral defense system